MTAIAILVAGGDGAQERGRQAVSYRAEVIADSSGKWVANALRFATEHEACAYGSDLAWHWLMVSNMRPVRVDEPPTHRWDYTRGTAVPLTGRDAP